MKKTDLHSAVKKLKKVAVKKSTLPILENIFNDNGKMTISTIQVEYTINVGFPGKFLIELKQFDKILSKLPAGANVEMAINGDKILLATNKGAKFSFPAQDFEDFPVMDKCPEKIGSLKNEAIELIKKAANFVSDDCLRPVMTGIFVSDKIVSSDAHRLVYYAYDRNLSSDILIPDVIIKAMNSKDYSVSTGSLNHDARIIKFESEIETITFREIEGKYPNYQAVIPEKTTCNYNVNTKDLIDSVNLALISANEASKLVVFDFGEDKLNVSSSDLDYDRSFSQDLECIPLNGAKEIKIGMKGTFLLDLLKDCGETVKIRMTDASRTILIDSDKLLMPMMLTNDC